MNPFLMAYANSYVDGKKLYPDTPEYKPEQPSNAGSGFAFGGQSLGQTAEQASPAPSPAPAPAPSGMLSSGFSYGGQAPGQTAADAKDQYGFSQKQYGDIKANWDAVKTDPAQMMKLMTDYGVDASALSRATGVRYDEIGNYLKTNGAANGFGGYSWQEPASAPAQGGFVVGGGNATTTPTTPAPAPSAPVAQAPTGVETAERRISGLLGVDQYGNYTNQVVRQAADRALQAFAGRGLLNSSMAQQAAQEAAIAKATEIATTDAGFLNSAREKDLDRQFQSSERVGSQQFQSGESAANRELQWKTALQNASASMQQAQLSADTQKSVADLNRQAQLMGNLSATTASMFSSFNTKVAEISASDLSVEAKNKMVSDLTTYLKSGVTMQGLINGDVNMQEVMNSLFPEMA